MLLVLRCSVVRLPGALRALPGLVMAASVGMVLAVSAPVVEANWVQRGGDVSEGVTGATGDLFGGAVDVSDDGLTIVVGATQGNPNVFSPTGPGEVRVFDWDGSAWVQRGTTTSGATTGDLFGSEVAISADGDTFAAAATGFDGIDEMNNGQVAVFDWDAGSGTWDQRGAALTGLASADEFGSSLDLSADGSRLLVGAPLNDFVGDNFTRFAQGQASVFEWDGNNWNQLGGVIAGNGQFDRFGISAAISDDGNVIAVGGTSDGLGGVPGRVDVYELSGSAWVQRGTGVTGDVDFGNAYEMGLSELGNTLVIGASFNDSGGLDAGQVQVFDWTGSAWELRGGAVIGTAGERFGLSVVLSNDGDSFAASGVNLSDDSGALFGAGLVKAYAWDGTAWVQSDPTLTGATNDVFGASLAMNADGSTIATGAIQTIVEFGDFGPGYVRVFDFPTSSLQIEHFALSPVTSDNFSAYPVSGSCSPIGSSVSVTATDGAVTTTAVVTACVDSGSGSGEFVASLNLAALGVGVTIESVVSSNGSTELDTDPVPSVLCRGVPVTIAWGPGAVATSGNDVIWGTDGADVINALGGDDTVCGRGGNDTINGGNGVDVILGGEGNDVLGGQGGNDELRGEAGADRLNGGPGNDTLLGGEGEDDLRGQSGADTLAGGAGVDQFFGGSGNDIITTGPGGNLGTGKVVRGQGNNDTITGEGEADDLEGGPGLDQLLGGGGDDLLVGGNAADRLFGGPGEDTLEGGASNDILRGGTQDDILLGGTGDDDLFGEGGDDTLNGQGDTDDCDGGSTDETLGDSATNCETTTGIEL